MTTTPTPASRFTTFTGSASMATTPTPAPRCNCHKDGSTHSLVDGSACVLDDFTPDWEQLAFNAVAGLSPERRISTAWGYLSQAVRDGQSLSNLQDIQRGLQDGVESR